MPLKSILESILGGIIEGIVHAVGEVVAGIISDIIPSKSSTSDTAKRTASIFNDELIYEVDEVDLQAAILEKPVPDYSKAAKRQKISGEIELSAILSSNGKVKNIRIVKAPRSSLARSAVRAARKIKFRPAMKDNIRVSQWVELKYSLE